MCAARDCTEFPADSGPKFSKKNSRPQNFAPGLAPKPHPIADAQPRHDPNRSPAAYLSVGDVRREGLHGISCGFRTEIFEKIFAAEKFSARIRPERAEIPTNCRRAASPRPIQVPSSASECRRCVPRGIARDFLRIPDRKFRKKNSGSTKFSVRNRPRSRQNPHNWPLLHSGLTLTGPHQRI